MREKVYVDRLFADYEDSAEVRDFKEEITANLMERVKANLLAGLGEEKAFAKAAGLAIVSFFAVGVALAAAVGIKAICLIPAICVLIFLLATEPERKKPWLKAMMEREIELMIFKKS